MAAPSGCTANFEEGQLSEELENFAGARGRVSRKVWGRGPCGRVIVLTMIDDPQTGREPSTSTHESGSWKLPGGFSVNWKGSGIRVIAVTNYLKWEGTGWQASGCSVAAPGCTASGRAREAGGSRVIVLTTVHVHARIGLVEASWRLQKAQDGGLLVAAWLHLAARAAVRGPASSIAHDVNGERRAKVGLGVGEAGRMRTSRRPLGRNMGGRAGTKADSVCETGSREDRRRPVTVGDRAGAKNWRREFCVGADRSAGHEELGLSSSAASRGLPALSGCCLTGRLGYRVITLSLDELCSARAKPKVKSSFHELTGFVSTRMLELGGLLYLFDTSAVHDLDQRLTADVGSDLPAPPFNPLLSTMLQDDDPAAYGAYLHPPLTGMQHHHLAPQGTPYHQGPPTGMQHHHPAPPGTPYHQGPPIEQPQFQPHLPEQHHFQSYHTDQTRASPYHQVLPTSQYQALHPAPETAYHQASPGEHDRRTLPNQQQEAESSRQHATTGDPESTFWNSGSSQFAPSFGSIPSQLNVGPEWSLSILVGPPPSQVPKPPLKKLPVPCTKEEYDLFRLVCLLIGSVPDDVKRRLICRSKPTCSAEHTEVLNFTVAVCGYPKVAWPTIALVSQLMERMLGRFLEWVTVKDFTVESRGSLPPEVWAKRMKAEASIGDMPELWGFKDLSHHPGAPQTSNPHYAAGTQGAPLVSQHTPSTASHALAQTMSDANFNMSAEFPVNRPPSHHSAPTAGASQAWSQGTPNLPGGYPSSVPGTSAPQSQYVYHQPIHSAITHRPSSTAASDGSPYSVPIAPTPYGVQGPNNSGHSAVYHRGSVSDSSMPMPSSGVPHESFRPMQAMAPPSFESILQYEFLRLLQLQNLKERANSLVELFYRSMYTETASFFTKSKVSPTYALVIQDVPEKMDQFVIYMRARFQNELKFVSKFT
ncbi:hypothetical protein V8D89_013850 [Ganoderma adspersum]